MNYFKILRKLQRGDKSSFDVPVNEQRAYILSLGEAKNDIDRGYKQYRCQNFFVSQRKVWLFNIAAAFIVPFVVLYYLLKGLFLIRGEQVEAMMERKGMDEVVPDIVKENYQPDVRYWKENASMSFADISFLIKLILQAPHHPYFVLKAWMNVAFYSDMIRRHSPKTMIQFGEFSYSSSILTAYCHRYGVKHIDVMHGEKLWFIRDAFFHYDECYVWDEHYVELFKEMKAEPTQFRVALPASMHIDTQTYQNKKVYADYKYYLAFYTEKQLKGIVQSMAFALHMGKTVKYRPHPRYSNMEILRKYVDEEDIESPIEVGILESISNLDCAVGSYTTVLSQAYFSGKNVILDDVANKEQYEKLKSMKYILAEKGCQTLSYYYMKD